MTSSSVESESNPIEDVETVAAEPASLQKPAKVSFPLSRICILLGTLLFAASHIFKWWELRLNAPQFPKGLYIDAKSYGIFDSPKTPFDDIDQVDGLNHYIGMMSLRDAATIEMKLAIPAIIVFVILGLVAVVWKHKRASLLTIPIILFPYIYALDLYYWLYHAGHNLDPMAAITIPPFTPHVLGTGHIAQFSTTAMFQVGWFMAAAGGILCLIGIVMSMRRKRTA